MHSPKIEEDLGIGAFATASDGIGGFLRQKEEDFNVREIPLVAAKAKDYEGTGKGGEFSIFWLQKRGLDTILAIKRIAKSLKVSMKRFSFAGMKDRNAVTLQRVSVWNVQPEKLKQIALNGIHIMDISRSENPIRVGSHWGNAFSIVARRIPLTTTEAEHRIQTITEEIRTAGGVSNYFGHQRFGLSRPVTHIVGLKMVRGEFREAAMTFLSQTSDHEPAETKEARAELAATGDYAQAIKRFPVGLSYELAMLNRLVSNPNNFVNSFRALPRKLVQIFVSAAQSWLFNKFLTARCEKNIALNECVQGDLLARLDNCGLPTNELVRIDQSNLIESNARLRDGKDIVVYPVPGFDMSLPKGMMFDIVREIMKQESLVPRSFWLSMMPEVSSRGVLRPIVLIPKDLKVTTFRSERRNLSDAKFEFSLMRGGYATVVLREFMKTSDPISAGY